MSDDRRFYKENPSDRVWWLDNFGVVGEFVFSFDRKKEYNLFADYPHNMTDDEVRIFDAENPFWADFFKDRKMNNGNR